MIRKLLSVFTSTIFSNSFSNGKSIENISIASNLFHNSTKITCKFITNSNMNFAVKHILKVTVFKDFLRTGIYLQNKEIIISKFRN